MERREERVGGSFVHGGGRDGDVEGRGGGGCVGRVLKRGREERREEERGREEEIIIIIIKDGEGCQLEDE